MAKYLYPAVFTKEDVGYSVNFPDLKNCFTSGTTLEEAMDMANDVLCLTLYDLEQDGVAIPAASAVNAVQHLFRWLAAIPSHTGSSSTTRQSRKHCPFPAG